MSRYIDAEWLMNFFTDIPDNFTLTIGNLRATVNEAPSIDIVRCGECKYWKSTVQMPNGTEVKCLYGRKADDFCSYGNRSEKPNNSKVSEIPTGSDHITDSGKKVSEREDE